MKPLPGLLTAPQTEVLALLGTGIENTAFVRKGKGLSYSKRCAKIPSHEI
jgi:hypothetical protein